jgi:putative endonuclease
MTNNSHKRGLEGELLAKNHLLAQHYEILAQNWRYRKYEVDIIARKDGILVFVEVKTRKNLTFGEPEQAVTRQKQNFLAAAANQYILENKTDLESRFDIITVTWVNNNPTVKHLEGAFYPPVK